MLKIKIYKVKRPINIKRVNKKYRKLDKKMRELRKIQNDYGDNNEYGENN